MAQATQLYYEFIDLDFIDYQDTKDSDILFIQSLIDCYGVTDARQILKNYFE